MWYSNPTVRLRSLNIGSRRGFLMRTITSNGSINAGDVQLMNHF